MVTIFFSLLNLNNSWKEQNKIRSMWLRKCSVLLRKCSSEEMSGWGSVCQGIAQVGEKSVGEGSVRDLSKGKCPIGELSVVPNYRKRSK